ncbi:MAG: GNAT family N-acetyltransferase [SAR202 cluster bacterium Io17-Chloro-G9]|nr:MAG: GNAT family N-acetyltransferase [SAR202 cluster bacterium Io17-Chloro-G9]
MATFRSPDLAVRQATLQDVDVLVEFNSAMALESEGKTLDQQRLRNGVTLLFDRDDRGYYLVAESEGRVVGQLLITYEWSDWRNAYFWWIQSVYVAPDWRRRGVYRSLHEYVLDQARLAGDVCGVRLYVDRDNHVAQQVYSNLGMDRSHYDLFEIDFVL